MGGGFDRAVQAIADTAEAIDFCDFYGWEALRLAGDQPLTRIPDERNELRYIPLGVGAVIPPWNFPLAILVGMTTGSIVAGNTVILSLAQPMGMRSTCSIGSVLTTGLDGTGPGQFWTNCHSGALLALAVCVIGAASGVNGWGATGALFEILSDVMRSCSSSTRA